MFTPPTDNLYKFFAIAGLILLVFSLYYPKKLVEEVSSEIIKLNASVDIAELSINKSITKQNKITIIEIDRDTKLLKQKHELSKFYATSGAIFSIVGFLLSLFGFTSRYIRVQKHIDTKLKYEIMDYELKFRKNTAETKDNIIE